MSRPLSNTLLSYYLGQIETALGEVDDDVTMLFGAENLRNEGDASQIVVVPTEDRFEGATVATGQPSNLGKVLRQCWTTVEFHIWGQPGSPTGTGVDMWDDVYSLRSELVQAMQDSLGGGRYRLLVGAWLKRGDDDGGEGEELMQYGRWYVLRAEILNPIVRQAPVVVELQSTPITPELNPPPPGS